MELVRHALGNRLVKEFHSLGHLALRLAEIAVVQHEAGLNALEKVGRIVEKRAKAKIGEYQDQAGPFVAWAELADATKEDRARQGYPDDEPLLRTGEMRDSIQHQVGSHEVQVGSNSDIAVYQELGTKHIPPRSFLGGAVVDEMDRVVDTVGHHAVAALVGQGVHGGRMLIEGEE